MGHRPFRNIILPVMILFPLMVLLVGCLYIPTFEHVDTMGAKKDFRTWALSPHNNFTRAQVEAVLGKPYSKSDNGQQVVYFLSTGQGIWVEPQCFAAFWASRKLEVLSLTYEKNGKLIDLYTLSVDCKRPPQVIEFIGSDEESLLRYNMRYAIQRINEHHGEDVRSAVHSDSYIYPSTIEK